MYNYPKNFIDDDVIKNEIDLSNCTLYDALMKLNDYNQWTINDLSIISGISRMSLHRYKYLKSDQKINKSTYNKLASAYNIKPNYLSKLPLCEVK